MISPRQAPEYDGHITAPDAGRFDAALEQTTGHRDALRVPAAHPRIAPALCGAPPARRESPSHPLRLANPGYIVGAGQHRSGWPYAIRSLAPLLAEDGILLDDFVERSFSYAPISSPYREPWIGIFHHPPHMPRPLMGGQRPQDIFRKRLWQQSLPSLKLAVALSHYLADYLAAELGVPTAVVTHPTETPALRFSEHAYLANPEKRVIQVGWYLRNMRAIYQLDAPPRFVKTLLSLQQPWIGNYERRIARWWQAVGGRRETGEVHRLPRADDEAYDRLLSSNVVFLELFDASASNAVIECIVRGTPILVNRHPAVEEYLGAEYPLFYDSLAQAGHLLSDERILAAHRYLRGLDKRPFDGSRFLDDIARAVDFALGT